MLDGRARERTSICIASLFCLAEVLHAWKSFKHMQAMWSGVQCTLLKPYLYSFSESPSGSRECTFDSSD